MDFEVHPDLPDSLYKFAAPAGALKILETGTLKFSRPTLFNDEFDMRVNLRLDIDEAAAIELALERLWEGLHGQDPILADNRLGQGVSSMRQRGVPDSARGEFDAFFRPTVKEQVEQASAMAHRLAEDLGRECARMKVLCLSANPTAAQLWGNYADSLTGAALRFSTRSEPRGFLREARPVTYSDEAPVLHTTESFADLMAGRRETDSSLLQSQFFYTKTTDWAPEREWRIVAGFGWKPDDPTELVPFSPRELEAVVLGTRASPEFREKVTRLVGQRYPHARIQELRRPREGMGYEIA
jgi:hypothetical protein